jgi:hypothetical protein
MGIVATHFGMANRAWDIYDCGNYAMGWIGSIVIVQVSPTD